MRIAFLTPEYPSELPDLGGIATYVQRIVRQLQHFGHEPEVFVTSAKDSATISGDGVPVHRIGWSRHPKILRIGFRASLRLVPSYTWDASIDLLLKSYALARALERRHTLAPFNLVQSADFLATGLFVRRCRGRVHAVRCSNAADLYNAFDQNRSKFEFVRGYLERLAMRRADVTYAPSRYLADYFSRVHDMNIAVIRPPKLVEIPEPSPLPFDLPSRFFIHFGMLMERKGTALLAEALPLAWKMAPELTMVWSGICWEQSKLERWRSLWGDRSTQVQITGPLPRAELYSILQRAEVAVLPSQVDNLPNTVIESLSLGIPVLGSRGASIDELVEEGRTGHLVELGDVHGLAETLVKMWLKRSPVAKGFTWQSAIADEMNPQQAVANLVKLCSDGRLN